MTFGSAVGCPPLHDTALGTVEIGSLFLPGTVPPLLHSGTDIAGSVERNFRRDRPKQFEYDRGTDRQQQYDAALLGKPVGGKPGQKYSTHRNRELMSL